MHFNDDPKRFSDDNQMGIFIPGKNYIAVKSGDLNEHKMSGTALHELDHAVDEDMGFPHSRGGYSQQALGDILSPMVNTAADYQKILETNQDLFGISSEYYPIDGINWGPNTHLAQKAKELRTRDILGKEIVPQSTVPSEYIAYYGQRVDQSFPRTGSPRSNRFARGVFETQRDIAKAAGMKSGSRLDQKIKADINKFRSPSSDRNFIYDSNLYLQNKNFQYNQENPQTLRNFFDLNVRNPQFKRDDMVPLDPTARSNNLPFPESAQRMRTTPNLHDMIAQQPSHAPYQEESKQSDQFDFTN